MIGIIMLIGIVKKNGIMLVDFAIEAEREHALSPRAAIHDACLTRFRPILMTTFAAIFGALPLALVSGTGAELRHPLGITIVGGLLISQCSRCTRRRRSICSWIAWPTPAGGRHPPNRHGSKVERWRR